jgi:hypothetical protein
MVWDAARYLPFACLAVWAIIFCVQARTSRLLDRRQRLLDEYQAWLTEEVSRIVVLDRVMMKLCVDAAGRDSHLAWQAWCATLGNIEVEIKGVISGRPWQTEYSLPTGAENVSRLLRENGADDR